MISHNKKFVYIQLQKTGTSSIFNFFKSRSLNSTGFSHLDPQININTARHYKYYFKFAFHRNPWDRMVSVWKYWTETRKDVGLISKLPETASFSGFCYNLSTIFYEILNPRFEKFHIANQSELNGHAKYLKLDFWGRFEYLDEDFKKICDQLKIKYEPLRHLNRTIHKNYREYYDSDLKKYIGKVYEKDIDTFKYVF
jgi:chondroitin 4-sulfotransferase 11